MTEKRYQRYLEELSSILRMEERDKIPMAMAKARLEDRVKARLAEWSASTSKEAAALADRDDRIQELEGILLEVQRWPWALYGSDPGGDPPDPGVLKRQKDKVKWANILKDRGMELADIHEAIYGPSQSERANKERTVRRLLGESGKLGK